MRCPTLDQLPPPPPGKTGWPWTEESRQLTPTLEDGSPWPRVSIVTPSYNQDRFLEETLRSVLLQGYPDLEYIVVDGSSTDDSVAILQKYERWLSWISEPDCGQTHAINKGWRRATGSYVSWINSDDVLLPGSLGAMVACLCSERKASLAYGDVLVIDSTSVLLPEPYNRIRGRPFRLEDMILHWQNPVPQQGFLMSRTLLDEIGYLDEAFDFTMDFEYWIRIALNGCNGVHIPADVAAFRHHPNSKSDTRQTRRIQDRYAIHAKVFSGGQAIVDGITAAESLANLHLSAAYVAYSSGEARHVRHYAWRHIAQQGFRASRLSWVLLLLSLLGDHGMRAVRGGWRGLRRAQLLTYRI